jgi:AGCS family alanine or glycine:cation symporter
MALLVGAVVLGGIQRIGAATSKIVPAMVAIYVLASAVVLLANFREIPHAFALIFQRAFAPDAAYGGVAGVIVWGVQRASFSNEAGLGSSAIAHAAAKTDEPIREGLVAMLEPFIDTVLVCTMTALVVIVSGAWQDPNIPQNAGVALTNSAFATVLPWFPKVLSVCVILFAYSTMISWCYYGERGWIYLLDHFNLGIKTLPIFRAIFVCFVFIGSVTSLGAVLTFSDILVLCIAMPNILGSVLLVPVIRNRLKDYFDRMKTDETSTNPA